MVCPKITKDRLLLIYNCLYIFFGTLYILRSFIDARFLAVFKVFPLLILILASFKHRGHSTIVKVIVAVLFGAAGDLVLQYGGQGLFALGAGSFLVGHLFYNIAILELWELVEIRMLLKRKIILLIVGASFLSISSMNLATTITDKVRDQNFMMAILLPVYLVFLSLNCVHALFLLCGSPKVSRRMLMLLAGTVAFFVSDNVLGKSIFGDFRIGGDKKYNSLVIMFTYYLAQYCMAHAIIGLSLSQSLRETPVESLIQSQ